MQRMVGIRITLIARLDGIIVVTSVDLRTEGCEKSFQALLNTQDFFNGPPRPSIVFIIGREGIHGAAKIPR